MEMWARLLASSASGFKPEYNFFIRMLREMSSSEAKLLEYIVSPRSHPHFDGGRHLNDVASGWHDPFVYIKLKACI